ncbi:site-2 protease family protein [Candidatus Peregrinibacteria bacterium]|nr:site-2 protease family protein [Candidatus Peregrinibacteria bacterium]MBI3816912.1 site-2 protease family protein [Candidatus Peregrinibacteria bacterium]
MISILLSAVAFLALLTVLVLIHELGHFTLARRAGVTVEEFGFGLPPRAKTLFWNGGTRFSLNWIPFGGFVRLQGENAETQQERTAKGSFANASGFWRVAILVAGVAMNFLFAIVLLTIGFSVGRWIPTYLTFEEMRAAAVAGEIHMDPGVLIDQVLPGGAAATAHVPLRGVLLTIDGAPVFAPTDVAAIQRGKTSVRYTLLPAEDAARPLTITVPVRDGKTGIGLVPWLHGVSAPERSVWTGFLLALRESRVMTVQTIEGIGKLAASLLLGGRVPEGITGIVGIAQLTHSSLQEGFLTYLRLVALLSLSLAILNILPLPALDGGRLLFVLIELVRGKPMNRTMETWTNAVGFAVLLGLIIIITYHDVVRLF